MKATFELRGITPALMHWNNIEGRDFVKEWQTDPANKNLSKAGDDRSPAWTWMTYVYGGEDGNICCPSQNIMTAIRTAATQMTMKRQKSFKEVSQNGMMITEEFCPFFNNGKPVAIEPIEELRGSMKFADHVNAVKEMGFKLDTRPVTIGTSSHIRVRPRFDNWSVRGTLEVYAPELTQEIVEQMFQGAGRGGLFDWRPSSKKPGRYGQFEAALKWAK